MEVENDKVFEQFDPAKEFTEEMFRDAQDETDTKAGTPASMVVPFVGRGATQNVPNTAFSMLEFPGDVRNPKRAIQMLGGATWLTKAMAGEMRLTRLTFRARGYPAFGDVHNTCSMLLRVKTRRKRNGDLLDIQTSLRGVIKKTMRFSGLADYQWLPPPGLARHNVHDLPHLLSFVKSATSGGDSGQPLHLSPLLFSRYDKPFDYQFKNNPYSRRAILHLPNGEVVHDRVLTRKVITATLIHKTWLDTTVPTEPPQEAILNVRRNSYALHLLPKVRELFEKRPVWSRTALSLVLSPLARDISHLLRLLLPPVSYTYSTGPYRCLYIRLGYNVREPPKEGEIHPVCYELIDIRLGRLTALRALEYRPQSLDFGVPRRMGREQPPRPAWPTADDPLFWDRIPLSWSALFDLMAIGGVPRVHQLGKPLISKVKAFATLFMQYIDIKDPSLLMQVQKMSNDTCRSDTPDSAWLGADKVKILRNVLQDKYGQWLASLNQPGNELRAAIDASVGPCVTLKELAPTEIDEAPVRGKAKNEEPIPDAAAGLFGVGGNDVDDFEQLQALGDAMEPDVSDDDDVGFA
ncbi:General transcription factor 3C polypeptide 5 [Diplonema papillatum]|nr:General transcription factor 3C polypeptide 5 [Diplonema papillatum]